MVAAVDRALGAFLDVASDLESAGGSRRWRLARVIPAWPPLALPAGRGASDQCAPVGVRAGDANLRRALRPRDRLGLPARARTDFPPRVGRTMVVGPPGFDHGKTRARCGAW